MTTIDRKQLDLAAIAPHPFNREFSTTGGEWAEFEEDIGARGIQEDLTVRVLPAGEYQCLRGHRRRHAGLRRKVKEAWCLVVECTDEEAFDHMWGENQGRVNVTPADEAEAVCHKLEDFGRSVEELARQWGRSVEWIRTRQRLLDLGDEVMEAVRRPGRDRLSIGAVEEILKVPEELRAEAVRLVLQPEFELGVLNEEQARDVLRKCLLEPKAKEAAWEAVRAKMVKSWGKRLRGQCLAKTGGDLMISSKSLRESEGLRMGYEAAETVVPLERVLPDAPRPPGGLRWLHLAVKYDVPVLVVPDDGQDGSRAIVNTRMVLDAEAALAEFGKGGNWLVVGKRKIVESGELRVESEEKKRVEKAQADLEAGFDTSVDVGEKPETVIEQGMTRHAMIRIGEVESLKAWAARGIAGEEPEEEDWMPGWACSASVYYEDIDRVCNWVMKLKI